MPVRYTSAMRLVTALVATLLLACAGWGRDHAARLRPDEDDLPLTIRCDAIPAAGASLPGVAITVEAPGGLRPIGELYDARRKPAHAPLLPLKKRHALVVDSDAFARTVQGDLERMLAAAPGIALGEGAPRLVVRILEVRTATPWAGWTALRGRMKSRVVLGAELRDAGRTLWSRELEGAGEKEVYYVRLVHHETTLAAAYCAALAGLRDATAELAQALSVRPAGGT